MNTESGGLMACCWPRRPFAEKYSKDQDAFFSDYVQARFSFACCCCCVGAAWPPCPSRGLSMTVTCARRPI